jgi:outer membrane protein
MKKIFFIALLVVAATTVGLAQFTKGSMLAGGSSNLGFGSDTYKNKSGGTTTTTGKITSFSLEPSVGYFFMDNLAAGAGLGLSTSSYKSDGGSSKSKTSSITLSPFARYYFDKLYAQGGFQIGNSKTEITNGSTTQTTKSGISGWSLAGGYAILLNESISIEPQIGYQSIGNKFKDSDNKIIHSGLFLRLGIFVYISK